MNKHLKYAEYVFKHKWYVFLESIKLGIPIRGLLHDFSKFHPLEWFPYCEYFYGSSRNGATLEDFDRAWLRHQNYNDHHWQWWVLHRDNGTSVAIPMSNAARKEMLADWIGVSRVLGGNVADWYFKNRDKIILNSETRAWVEEQLELYS